MYHNNIKLHDEGSKNAQNSSFFFFFLQKVLKRNFPLKVQIMWDVVT